MTTVEKLSITLTPDMAQCVRAAVAEGDYASTSEVVRDALRLWQERRDCFGHTLEQLQHLVQEGLESGPAQPWNKAAFLAEAQRRLAPDND